MTANTVCIPIYSFNFLTLQYFANPSYICNRVQRPKIKKQTSIDNRKVALPLVKFLLVLNQWRTKNLFVEILLGLFYTFLHLLKNDHNKDTSPVQQTKSMNQIKR